MSVLLVLEFRPVRLLLSILTLGAFLGARTGDPRGVLLAAICAALLWWRPLLAKVHGVLDAMEWVRDKLAR